MCVCVCVLGSERQKEKDRQTEREATAHLWKRKDSFHELVIFFLPSITWVLWTELKSSGAQWWALSDSFLEPPQPHSTRQSHKLPCVCPSPCAWFSVNSPHGLIGPQLMELIEKIGLSLHWRGYGVTRGGRWGFKSQRHYQCLSFLDQHKLLLWHHSFLPTAILPQHAGHGLWPSGTMRPWLNAFSISCLGHFLLSWQQNTKTPL